MVLYERIYETFLQMCSGTVVGLAIAFIISPELLPVSNALTYLSVPVLLFFGTYRGLSHVKKNSERFGQSALIDDRLYLVVSIVNPLIAVLSGIYLSISMYNIVEEIFSILVVIPLVISLIGIYALVYVGLNGYNKELSKSL